MIVRTHGDFHYLIRQPEHARQSAIIAAHLRDEYLGPMDERRDLILATNHHDDGWHQLESSPQLASDGLPLNFSEIEKPVHCANWQRTIFLALRWVSAPAAAFVARHARVFLDSYGEHIAVAHAELIQALQARAWPALNQTERDDRLENAFATLHFADALSLLTCAGWTQRLQFTLRPLGAKPLTIDCWNEKDWTVRITPWPFATEALEAIPLDAVAVPRGHEQRALQMLGRPADYLIRIPTRILPAE